MGQGGHWMDGAKSRFNKKGTLKMNSSISVLKLTSKDRE